MASHGHNLIVSIHSHTHVSLFTKIYAAGFCGRLNYALSEQLGTYSLHPRPDRDSGISTSLDTRSSPRARRQVAVKHGQQRDISLPNQCKSTTTPSCCEGYSLGHSASLTLPCYAGLALALTHPKASTELTLRPRRQRLATRLERQQAGDHAHAVVHPLLPLVQRLHRPPRLSDQLLLRTRYTIWLEWERTHSS